MCNPTTQRPISEALPLVNALIAEAERNCIDISHYHVHALPEGRFDIALYAYDGAREALCDLLGLHSLHEHFDPMLPVDYACSRTAVRKVGRWLITSAWGGYDEHSDFPLDVEAAAA